MFCYHDTPENKRRLSLGICRCASNGPTYDLKSLVHDGRIKAPGNETENLTTPDVRVLRSDPEPEGSGYGKTFIFAVNIDHEIRVALDSERTITGSVKHETLFHNADVIAAGEIAIRDGIVTRINDFSGSYATDGALEEKPSFSVAVLKAFNLHALPVDSMLLEQLEHLTHGL